MQEVLPDVFLGPLQISRSNQILLANRITLLIPVRTPHTVRFLSIPKDEDGKLWPAFPVDIEHDQIMGWFYKTYLRVKEEVENGGRVLIYCENGNGLSAAICVALVMDTRLYCPASEMADVDGITELLENLFKGNGIVLTFRTGRDSLWRYHFPEESLTQQYQPLVEARSQTAGIDDSERLTRRRHLDEVYEEEIREGTFSLGLPHWYFLLNWV